ncbi:hypothetical protein M2302_000287 [Micromonospora sp. A200]|uniref:endonuclease domain-containing protein n=1 Tax=Micromonospora sp. A200 TaxID=2940568 RepID=UPI002474FDE6|nr:endonuclease domain-containing protein [Micromonospora sp. A200]MDH6460136.1 hypothetical protein [Micromonospora sp. A200]
MTEQADGRWCRRCGEWRAFSDFADDGLSTPCATCRERKLAQQRERRWAAGPEATRASDLWRKYRMRPADYDALRAEQDYRCAICRTHEDDITTSRGGRPRLDGSKAAEAFKLVVDHCHTTGRVRGLLCNRCNFLIGKAGESEATLISAIAYLKRQP